MRERAHELAGPVALVVALLATGTGCASADRSPSAAYPQQERSAVTVAGSAASGYSFASDTLQTKKTSEDREEDAAPAEPRAEVAAKAPPPPAPPPGSPPAQTTPGATAKPTGPSSEEPARDPSMIVYTARVTMAVYQVDQGLSAVERIARDMGGYLALKRDREITIRVPRARFEPTLAAIDRIGDIVHRDVQAQDVTDEYVDLEIRIKNSRAMQTRLKQLLDKANVKEAIEIEKELHRVTEELELLEGKIKLLKDKIAYSTITVEFQPRGASVQATRVRLPFPWLSHLGLPGLLSLEESK